MKTLKMVSGALLIILSTSAFSADKNEKLKKEKFSMNYTIHKYIDALSYGRIQGVAQILDNNVKLTITGGNKTLSYDRAQVLLSLQKLENIQQNCSTGYTIVDLNSTQAIVKVTMKYENFSRINFITMANTAEGWKITNVSSSFL